MREWRRVVKDEVEGKRRGARVVSEVEGEERRKALRKVLDGFRWFRDHRRCLRRFGKKSDFGVKKRVFGGFVNLKKKNQFLKKVILKQKAKQRRMNILICIQKFANHTLSEKRKARNLLKLSFIKLSKLTQNLQTSFSDFKSSTYHNHLIQKSLTKILKTTLKQKIFQKFEKWKIHTLHLHQITTQSLSGPCAISHLSSKTQSLHCQNLLHPYIPQLPPSDPSSLPSHLLKLKFFSKLRTYTYKLSTLRKFLQPSQDFTVKFALKKWKILLRD